MTIIRELAGKTIEKAWTQKNPDTDDEPYLFLKMSDGSEFEVSANYGSYTGNSEDEYPRFISIKKVKQ